MKHCEARRAVTMNVIEILPSSLSACVCHHRILLAFLCRLEKTGVNPVAFKGSGSAHDFIGRLFKLLFALIVIVVFVHSLLPNVYQYFMPVAWLERVNRSIPLLQFILNHYLTSISYSLVTSSG